MNRVVKDGVFDGQEQKLPPFRFGSKRTLRALGFDLAA